MGVGEAERGKATNCRTSNTMSKLGVLLVVVGTNLFTLIFLSGPFNTYLESQHHYSLGQIPFPSLFFSDDIRAKFNETQQQILHAKADLQSSQQLTQRLIVRLTETLNTTRRGGDGADDDDPWAKWTQNMPREAVEFIAGKKLPAGFKARFGSHTMQSPIGHACGSPALKKDLQEYMNYKPGDRCPDDEILAQRLMLGGCEPLPRRRCYPTAPANYTEPLPLPRSMWTTPPDSSVVWTAYTCKSYRCLIDRKNSKSFDDCKDCFDLQGRERHRWLKGDGSLRFSIDEVLQTKNGTIRIGLDIGGGSGTFAVRMRERNVTVVTTSMNFNGPFNAFMASRGVVPLYITVSQRLPFFDNTLDIVHSMHVLSNWIPTQILEFILYDIYRILRPGGVFWLDHFFCEEDQLSHVYVPMLESFSFNKLRWVIGRKLDRADQRREMYISALLEKPLHGRN